MKKINLSSIPIIIAILLSLFGLFIIFDLSRFNSLTLSLGILNTCTIDKYSSIIGGIVGPIFSLAGVLLIYATIMYQKKSFQVQQFENKFFELIKYHRENVSNMEYLLPDNDEKTTVIGHKAIVEMCNQLENLYDAVVKLFNKIPGLSDNSEFLRNRIAITYLMFFYGVSEENKGIVKSFFPEIEQEVFNQLWRHIREKKTNYDSNIVYFGGHQHRLGHYYRHFYQTVKFVDNAPFLNKTQKYDYVKTLRVQLNTYEQTLFLFNSLSPLGKNWRKNGYVNRYQLIKNLPQSVFQNIKPKSLYPKIDFEWESE